jgi:transcriptional regulator with XRE-family HTH domain
MRGYGRRLRELRKHLNMSQKEFGALFGLTRSGLGKHEREDSFLTSKMLQILADKYNVSMDYLLCNRGTLFYERGDFENGKGKYIINDEVKELLSLMTRVPLVRHSVMGYFQRFKIENREIIEKELAKAREKQSD